MKRISLKIQEIKIFTGLTLTRCEYFTGINKLAGKEYFNITLKDNVSESEIYDKLSRLVKNGLISNVEPNGGKRLAIFF